MLSTESDDSSLAQNSSFMHIKTLGDYNLLRPIGIGGMGEVYLAEQKSMQRMVALKILLPALVNNKHSLERFFLEVRTLAKIEHPNIVQAIEAGIDDDVCYFSMMYVQGKNLSEIIAADRFIDEINALKIVRDIAVTLDYAWKKHHLIHRDIKPSNIMLSDEGVVKLLDFGISKIAGDDREELTQCGTIIGSPYYVSPEQARSTELDFHADMYSLGCTLYQILTGKPPFDAPTSLGIISKHFCESAVPPKVINKKVSTTVSAITMRMIAKKPYERFPEWKDLIDECDKYLSDKGVLSISTLNTNSDKAPHTLKKNTKLFSPRLLFILIISIISALILIVYSHYENKHRNIREFCVRTIQQAEDCTPQQYPMVIANLEQILRLEQTEYSTRAKELLKLLGDKIIENRVTEEKRNVELEIISIKQKSYRLEIEKKYAAAIELWRYQLNSGQYRNNQTLRDTANSAIKSLQELAAASEQRLE
jgi:serine/threonine protein kinase